MIFDHGAWANGVVKVAYFDNNRWASVDSHGAHIFQSLAGDSEGNIVLEQDTLNKAALRVNRPLVLDASGECMLAIRECPDLQRALLKPLKYMPNNDSAWDGRSVSGFIKGTLKETVTESFLAEPC